MNTSETPYRTKSAVLFVVFNRPEETARVLDKIREARPPRLYIAADGPRVNKPGEDGICKQTREIALNVDWNCEVKTLFKDSNVGCKLGVSTALQWFFENEEEGIVLEDDALPSNDFFRFCDEMLDRYRHDTRIWAISGSNFQQGQKWGEASYYFSNLIHVWGWASWRRAWNEYDITLKKYDEKDLKEKMSNIFDDQMIVDSWYDLFVRTKSGQIDTWDYQFGFSSFFNNGLSIVPNHNLVTNVGFGANATNTFNEDSTFSKLPLEEIGEIKHPLYILPEKRADLFSLNKEFYIEEKKRQNRPRKRFKYWLKSKLGIKK